jgi:hypothetical protein
MRCTMRRHGLYNSLPLLHVLVMCQKAIAESAVAADYAGASTEDHIMTQSDASVIEVEDDNHQDQERDDRTWLDVFGQAAKEYLTTQLIPPTDASCVWDWRVARCEPFCQCAFLPAWGDYHLGRSCRYKPASSISLEAICAPQEILTFDQLRMEYEASPQLAHLGDIPPLKQLLFRTVKALQTTRDYLQKVSFQIQSSTRKHYEALQENTCTHSCIPPSQWSLKQALICQGWESVLCPEEQMETTDNDNNKLRLKIITDSWKQLWNKLNHPHPPQDEDTVHDFSRYTGYNRHHTSSSILPPSLSLPEWSTASDWSAGIVIPKQKPTRNYSQRSPRPHVTPGLNENSAVFDNNEEEPLAESQQQQQTEIAPRDPSAEDSTNSQVKKRMASQGDNDDGVFEEGSEELQYLSRAQVL